MKAKTCKQEGCSNPAFSKGWCTWHKPKAEKKPLRARSPIKKVSGKRAKELAVYGALRKSFLEMNNICQICLSLPSCDVHHIHAGADRAKYLNDTSTWMALCRDCHQNKVHLDPVNARLNGWLK